MYFKLIIFIEIIAFLIYLLLATLTTFIFCRHRFNEIKQIIQEIWYSFNAILFGTPVVIIFKLFIIKYTKIYFNIIDYGYIYFILSSLSYFILFDMCTYLLHRFLHFGWFYRNIHSLHHKFKNPTPYGSISLHPMEYILNIIIPSTTITFLIPIHITIWLFTYLIHTLWTVIIHDGIEFEYFKNILTGSKHHMKHHNSFNYNYGFIFCIWDKSFNTEKNH